MSGILPSGTFMPDSTLTFSPPCSTVGHPLRCSSSLLCVSKGALYRENTEGEYSGLEHEVVPDVVESLKIITQVSLPCSA